MKRHFLLWLLAVVFLANWNFPVQAQEKPSALQADPKGWLDIFPGKGLQGWKRVAIAPETKLDPRQPWSIDASGKVLQCDGVGIKEMLLYDKEFTNGIFHVEWRFRPVTEGKKDYNSGIYIRTPHGQVWLQAQVAHLPKPPHLGDLFGDVPVKGKIERVLIRGEGDKRANPPGQWNTYEITCQGRNISVWINGVVACTWKDCPLPRGHVGMQAEYYYIEFRNLKFKELP